MHMNIKYVFFNHNHVCFLCHCILGPLKCCISLINKKFFCFLFIYLFIYLFWSALSVGAPYTKSPVTSLITKSFTMVTSPVTIRWFGALGVQWIVGSAVLWIVRSVV